jgi:hypothetical protein
MILSLTDYSLPNVYIGDEVVPEYVPVAPVVPEPQPAGGETDDVPTDPTEPTSNKLSTAEVLMISGGTLILILLVILIILLVVTRNKKSQSVLNRESSVNAGEADALVY